MTWLFPVQLKCCPSALRVRRRVLDGWLIDWDGHWCLYDGGTVIATILQPFPGVRQVRLMHGPSIDTAVWAEPTVERAACKLEQHLRNRALRRCAS